jgi:starch synthase
MEGFSRKDAKIEVRLGEHEERGTLWEGALEDGAVRVYLLDHAEFYDREQIYGPPGGEYDDNLKRFAFLSYGALKLCHELKWYPHIVHVHDWHAALAAVYLSTLEQETPLKNTASLLTIHNADYQGLFPAELMPQTGLSWVHYTVEELEFYNQVCLLKGGITHATLLTAVSPTYAQEIQRSPLGRGLEGVFARREDDLYGVLNGIDYEVWNPGSDALISAPFSQDDIAGKARCKRDLQKRMGLAINSDVPLVGLVTRLAWQKGIDVLLKALSKLLQHDVQVVILGAGDPKLEQGIKRACRRWPEKIAASIGYSDEIAHQIYAGADFFLMPSRSEPCGLGQMYAMRYGTLPIVRATGGLEDTVEDYEEATSAGTGFKFKTLKPKSLMDAVIRATTVYRERKDHIARLRRTAMQKRFSWATAAEQYDALYEEALKKVPWRET